MEKLLQQLNVQQKEAVKIDKKHVLILAGAGTGKTKAITTRIIYLINNEKINPGNILAVTFTNKAANEMKERVLKYIKGSDVTIKTFHSFGAYILRREAFAIGRNKYFQIYDSADSKKALKEVLKKFDFAKSEFGRIQKWIQEYKQQIEIYSNMKYFSDIYKEIYNAYNKYLQDSNSFDFEDLILQPIKIFSKYPDILSKYQSRFKYILVDEYQDTNKSQFELLKFLAGKDNKVMVVGDEDQSIYKFRGADISNILNFEKDFVNAKIIRLEQNYRSTTNILNTANSIIENNTSRLGKKLFTNKLEGNKIILFEAYNEIIEVEKILELIKNNNMNLNNIAILYRTNNQSRPFEQVFNKQNIPYIIIGAIRFFEREEIKDAISILKWLINPKDKIAFGRFVNKPIRGIGKKSLSLFFTESENFNDLFDALQNISKIKTISKRAGKALSELGKNLKEKNKHLKEKPIDELIYYYLEKLGLLEYFKEKDDKDGTEKIKNITEFIKTIEHRGKGEKVILSYLEEVSLSPTETDENHDNKIKLMTIHNAKGLEFDNVFIAGVEQGLFPHSNSLESDEEYEEERRLFYVAITRAKKNLIISYCSNRNIFGWENKQEPSDFIQELPIDLLELKFLNKNVTNRITPVYLEGDIVRHKEYGKGEIIRIKKSNGKHLAKIDFWDYSFMELILEYTKLEKVFD